VAQGKGFWYNPKTDIAVEVHRHEIDLKNRIVQSKLNISEQVIDALKTLTLNPENEDKIKMIGVRTGLVRIRDWQQFTSIQFFGRGDDAKDTLFALAQLIRAYKDKTHKKLREDTPGLSTLLGSSWTLKLDNLSTGDSDTLSPEEYLKKYHEEGYMEDTKEDKSERPVRDLPFSKDLVNQVEDILDRTGYFKNEKVGNLFEDLTFRIKSKKMGLIDEDITLSRVWKLANDGKHVFTIISAFRNSGTPEQLAINRRRNRVLEDFLRRKGYGFNKISGYWTEFNKASKPNLENLESSKEDSYFVTIRVPEDELAYGLSGKTVSRFVKDFSGVIQGSDDEDDEVPDIEEVLIGTTGFNQDMIAIKIDPSSPTIFLMDRTQGLFPLGEVEYFSDIRNTLEKLPTDIIEKIASGAGGIAFSDLRKTKGSANIGGSFRAGSLNKGE